MNAIVLHDAFVGAGCEGRAEPQPAVSIEAGRNWRQAYQRGDDQGGTLRTGRRLHDGRRRRSRSGRRLRKLFQGFWHRRGEPDRGRDRDRRRRGQDRQRLLVSRPLLGAQGRRRRVRRRHPRDPAHARAPRHSSAASFATIKATSDDAARRLIGKIDRILSRRRFSIRTGASRSASRPGSVVSISMVFQGLGQQEAEAVWRPFFDWVAASPQDFAIVSAPRIGALPAQRFWDPALLKRFPASSSADDRAGAPADNIFWAGNRARRVGSGTPTSPPGSPASLLEAGPSGERFADALFRRGAALARGSCISTRGSRAAGPEAIAAARETAMNPAVVDAFALAISGALAAARLSGRPRT